MRIWLVTVGEPLPTDGTGERLLRTGLLADTLAKRGHEVCWWTSSFDHTAKRQRTEASQTLQLTPNYQIRLLHAAGYRRNVSVARFRHHAAIAKAFRNELPSARRPDVILSSLPLWELCDVATQYAVQHAIPTVLDVRDMWPDAIIDLAPAPLRPLARLLAYPATAALKRSVTRATGISGMTDAAVRWALDSAGKPAGADDRSFPFGYRSREPSPSEQREAYAYWQSHGLTPECRKFTLCFFGAVGPHFDIDTILQASRSLRNSGRQVRFVLCGTGDHLQQWRAKAAGDENIVLPGWVNAAKIWTLMQLSSAGIAPYHSSWDFQLSIPNKPIEYLSGGLPVVSSLEGELQRLLADNRCGATYQTGQPQQLCQIISDFYDNPPRRDRFAARAAALYRQRFVAKKVYGDMSDFLEELALRSSARTEMAVSSEGERIAA